MKYLSCFSGIGGLEASTPPELFCEADSSAASVLEAQYPDKEVWPDVQTLEPPQVDVVAGGWPCQDLSIAGLQEGLKGLRSGLLLDMLSVARDAGAHTIVAENVPNLLRLRRGEEFGASLAAFAEYGYPYVAWRLMNARAFGLPQHRARVLMIASKAEDVALTLFRPLDPLPRVSTASSNKDKAAGFYWTAGTHSINYSRGYVPTIKVGSSLGIVSAPAVHFDGIVRKISPSEALRLQGFELGVDLFPSRSAAYRAAGNAVPKPIGRWVLDGLTKTSGELEGSWLAQQTELWQTSGHSGRYPRAGMYERGRVRARKLEKHRRATDLIRYLDQDDPSRLSARASSGLLRRLERSGHDCPAELRTVLEALAATKEERIG